MPCLASIVEQILPHTGLHVKRRLVALRLQRLLCMYRCQITEQNRQVTWGVNGLNFGPELRECSMGVCDWNAVVVREIAVPECEVRDTR